MPKAFQGKQKEWAKIVAQAWADEGFKARLLSDPRAVLKENGIELPENAKVSINEAKADEINLTLPPRPDSSVYSVDELSDRIAAFCLCCN